MQKQNNVVKIIAVTIMTLIIAMVIEFVMFNEHEIAWTSGSALTTLAMMVIIMIIVVLLAVADWHFSNYATIIAMLYYGIISLGGLLQIHGKSTPFGLLIQLLAIIGLVLCVYGLVLGFKQRELYMRNKYRKDHRGMK